MYIGIGPEDGTVVEEDQAYEYALERSLHGTPEDQHEFKEFLAAGRDDPYLDDPVFRRNFRVQL